MIFGKKEKELREEVKHHKDVAEHWTREYARLEQEHKKLKAIFAGERECSNLCTHCKYYLETKTWGLLGVQSTYDCELNIKCKDYERKRQMEGE